MKKEKLLDKIKYKKKIKNQNLKNIKKLENLICFNDKNELELKRIKRKTLINSSLLAIILILTSIIVTILTGAVLVNFFALSFALFVLDKIRVLKEEDMKIELLETWVRRLTPIENEEFEYLAQKIKFIKKDYNYENEYMCALKAVSFREHVKIFEPKKSLKNFEIIKFEEPLLKEKNNKQNLVYVDDDININSIKNKPKIKTLN